MINPFYMAYTWWTGRIHPNAPIKYIQQHLMEKRPLPVGMSEFHEWSDRIISGAALPATPESQKYTLANMILHLKPTDDAVEDIYFIKCLRKFASNQVADYYRQKEYAATKERLKQEEQSKAEATATTEQDGKVLEISRV